MCSRQIASTYMVLIGPRQAVQLFNERLRTLVRNKIGSHLMHGNLSKVYFLQTREHFNPTLGTPRTCFVRRPWWVKSSRGKGRPTSSRISRFFRPAGMQHNI